MQDAWQEFASQTDNQLMVLVRDERCVRSFEVLVDRWREPIVRLCYRMVYSWDDAEDMTQEVFSRLFQNRIRYKSSAQFSTYIWKIAINRCRDFHRAAERMNKRQRELIESTTSQHRLFAPADDTEDRVRVALNKLPPMFREVLILRHYQNLKFKQISDVLEIPFGTVASRMSKALKLLGEQLGSDSKTQ